MNCTLSVWMYYSKKTRLTKPSKVKLSPHTRSFFWDYRLGGTLSNFPPPLTNHTHTPTAFILLKGQIGTHHVEVGQGTHCRPEDGSSLDWLHPHQIGQQHAKDGYALVVIGTSHRSRDVPRDDSNHDGSHKTCTGILWPHPQVIWLLCTWVEGKLPLGNVPWVLSSGGKWQILSAKRTVEPETHRHCESQW